MIEPSIRDLLRSWPRGLFGMLVLVGLIESTLARRDMHFSNATAANWRYASRNARGRVREAEILCLGTSLTNGGVLPLVIEERLGRPTGNLAVFGGPIAASYFLLKHALDSGARPRVVLLDCQDSPIAAERAPGPRANLWNHVRQWPELLGLGECLDLAWSAGDGQLFGVLAVSRVLPSARARFEIRASLLSALAGRSGSSFYTIAAVHRNWKMNKGAHVISEGRPTGLRLDHPEVVGGSGRWEPDAICDVYARRLMDLAIVHGIRVFWLLPPIASTTQAWRDRTGLEDYFARLARSMQTLYPDVIVVDGRSSGFPAEAFGDGLHLNRRGAVAYSRSLAEIVDRGLADRSSVPSWVALPPYRETSTRVRVEDIDESRMAVLRTVGANRIVR